MKKKQIIASLREELDMMRQRAESAERKLFGEPVWVDADDEEIDFGCKYCLAKDIKEHVWGKDITFPAGTAAQIVLRAFVDSFIDAKKKSIIIEFGSPYEFDSEAFEPLGGWLRLDFSLSPSDDCWRDHRLSVPVRKVKIEVEKEC